MSEAKEKIKLKSTSCINILKYYKKNIWNMILPNLNYTFCIYLYKFNI